MAIRVEMFQPAPWDAIRQQVAAASDPATALRTLAASYSAPTDVFGIARGLGVRLLQAPMNEQGRLSVGRNELGIREATIVVKSDDHVHRQRFTVGHELGHLFLHDLSVAYRDLSISSSVEDPKEREANSFAAELLMPRDLVLGAFSLGYRSPEQVAGVFFVSPAAAGHRLRALGIIS